MKTIYSSEQFPTIVYTGARGLEPAASEQDIKKALHFNTITFTLQHHNRYSLTPFMLLSNTIRNTGALGLEPDASELDIITVTP
jgi:hypothetical protein